MALKREAACLVLAMSVSMTSWLAFAWGQTDWYLLKAAGETIGQVRINRYQKQEGKLSANVTEVSHINRLKREGAPFEVSMVSRFEESRADGKPLKFSYHYQLNRKTWVDASGDFQSNGLSLHLLQPEQGDQLAKREVALARKEPFLFPDGPAIQKVYQKHAYDPPGSTFRFQTMHLGLSPRVVDTQVTLLSLDELRLADGSARSVRKFEVKNPLHPENAIYEWRDASGKLYKAQTSDKGMEMVYTTRQEARLPQGTPLAEVMAQGIPVNTFAANPKEVRQAVYLLKPTKGQTTAALQTPPRDARQQVETLPGKGFKVTVLRKEPEDISFTLPFQPSLALQPYLQSSPYIQASDAEIQKTAQSVASGESRAYAAAQRLRQWVYQNIVNKNYDTAFAGARETLLNRSGDCTEHAVLLAALARAIGLPSRLAVGLLYLPDAVQGSSGRFVYHMWTEVWLGKNHGQADKGEWVPLDASQKEPWVGADRIKLADSALNSEEDLIRLTRPIAQWMGQLQIEVFQALSPTQSAISLSGANDAPVLKLDINAQAKQLLETVDLRLSRRVQFLRVGGMPPSLLPDAPEALFTQGVEQLAKHNRAAAVRAFEQSVQRTENPFALYRLGERLLSVKMPELALSAFDKASKREPRLAGFVSEWQAEIRRAPADIDHLEARGDNWLDKGEFAKAREAYQQAEKAMSIHSRAWLGYRLARIHGKQALATGAARLKSNQRDAMGWLLAGRGLLACGEAEEAKKAFQNALKIQPDLPEPWLELTALALDASDWEFLEQAKPKLERWQNERAEAARLLGLIQLKRRHYQEAGRLLESARRRAPQDAKAFLDLANLYERMPLYEENIGKTVQTALWTQRAIDSLRVGIATASEKTVLRLRLGQTLLEKGKSAEAAGLAEQVLNEDPLNGKAYLLAGMAALYRNNLPVAQVLLGKAQVLEPYNADVLVNLGHIAKEKGNEAQAVQLYRQAVRLEPNNALAVAALQQAKTVGLRSILKTPLNADEHAYLVQALWTYRKMLLAMRDELQAMDRLLSQYGPPEFSLDTFQLIREAEPLSERFTAQQAGLYEMLAGMTPPRQLADFHAHLLALAYASLKCNEEPAFSGVFSKSEAEALEKDRQITEAELLEKRKAFEDIQDALRAQLPKATWDALLLEARWDTYPALWDEILALKKALEAKHKA
jgi:Tfp pilus assembly protein PilF